jgi:hypothetical protein
VSDELDKTAVEPDVQESDEDDVEAHKNAITKNALANDEGDDDADVEAHM